MEKESMSITQIFKTIFANKWVAPVTALVVAIVCTLTLHFGYFLKKSEYSISFSVLSDGEFSLVLFAYDDGTSFYVDNYISKEVLEKAKSSSSAFDSIDVATIASTKSIKCTDKYSSLGYEQIEDNSNLPILRQITISVPAKYFDSYGQACNFLNDLVYYPTNKYNDIEADYKIYLDDSVFDNVLTYGEQIDLIQSQISYIQSSYSSLQSQAEDKNLVEKSANKFNSWVRLLNLDTLRTEANANKYLKNLDAGIEKFNYELIDLKKQLTDAKSDLKYLEEHIKATQSSSTGGGNVEMNVTSELIGLKSKITTLERRISDIYEYIEAYYEVVVPTDLTADLEYKLDGNNNKILKQSQVDAANAYGEKIRVIYNQLKGNGETDYIEEFSKIKKQVTVSSAKNVIRSVSCHNGESSIILSAIIGVFFGVIVGCFVGFIVGMKKKNAAKSQTNDQVN